VKQNKKLQPQVEIKLKLLSKYTYSRNWI